MRVSIILFGFVLAFLSYYSVNSLDASGNLLSYDIDQHTKNNDDNFEPYEIVISLIFDILFKLMPDPIHRNNINMNFSGNNPLISGVVNINDLNISGIHQINTNNSIMVKGTCTNLVGIQICIPHQLSMDIVIPNFSFGCAYDAENLSMIEQIFPLWGNGNLSMVTDLKLSIYTKFTLDPVAFDNITISYDINNLTFSVAGLLNDTEFSQNVQQFLNEDVVQLLKSYSRAIGLILSELIKDVINQLLKQLSAATKSLFHTFLISLSNN